MEVFAIGTELLLASQTYMGEILVLDRTRVFAPHRLPRRVAGQRPVRELRRQGGMSNPAEMRDDAPNVA
jgi:hypothetical protein